jgi:hypothetical protein
MGCRCWLLVGGVPILPLLPGTPQQATHDYARHGTTNLYAALEAASGKVISQLTARHRALEFKRSLDHINQQVPAGLDVRVICDNSSTYKKPGLNAGCLAIRASTCTSPALQLMAEPGRAVVRRADQQVAQAWHAPDGRHQAAPTSPPSSA